MLGRVLLSERAGVPRRLTVASIVYEQALQATSAIVVAAYFLIVHPDLQGQPLRWAILLLIPLLITILHPRVFGPLANRVLRAFGREPLPEVMPLRGVIAVMAFYVVNWGVIAVGIYCVARSVSSISPSDLLVAGAAQAFGYVAALATLVAPAGLGIRDAAFAWAFKVAAPGDSFAVASLIAIVVRGVQTVVEIVYVGIVTALGRREGWSIHTGVLHPSPEEEAGSARRCRRAGPVAMALPHMLRRRFAAPSAAGDPRLAPPARDTSIAGSLLRVGRRSARGSVAGAGGRETGRPGGGARAGTKAGARRWPGGGRRLPRRRLVASRRLGRSR